jgi:hypothetical protein
MIFFILILLAFSSCGNHERTNKDQASHLITLCGRDGGAPIYQAGIPPSWKRINPKSHQILTDTTLPICSFEAGNILITVHNFPYTSLEQRVPPLAQIERWKGQFGLQDGDVTPVAHGGFGGFRLEGYDPYGTGLIAYAMQMTPILFRSISNPQIKADYTLKAVGPSSEIEAEKGLIDAFAKSFELIEPISSPL